MESLPSQEIFHILPCSLQESVPGCTMLLSRFLIKTKSHNQRIILSLCLGSVIKIVHTFYGWHENQTKSIHFISFFKKICVSIPFRVPKFSIWILPCKLLRNEICFTDNCKLRSYFCDLL